VCCQRLQISQPVVAGHEFGGRGERESPSWILVRTNMPSFEVTQGSCFPSPPVAVVISGGAPAAADGEGDM
jgi:hypothetical protein